MIKAEDISSIADFSINSVLVAVSNTFDPLGIWKIYEFEFSNCPDRPAIGINDDKFIIAVDLYTNNCDPVLQRPAGMQYTIADKNDMLRSVDPPVSFRSNPDRLFYNPFPVQSLGSTSILYMTVKPLFPPGDVDLYSFDGPVSNMVTGITNIPSRVPPEPEVHFPPNAIQPGTTNTLDTGDTRVLSAVWKDDKLWFASNVGCYVEGVFRSCFRLIEYDTARSVKEQDFDVGLASRDFFYPALMLDSYNNLGIIFGSSSSVIFPSLMFSGQTADANPGMLNVVPMLVATGRGAQTTHQRYGDYFGAAVDPSDPRLMWFAGEYMDRYVFGSSNNPIYSTFIERVQMPAPIVAPGITIDGPSRVELDGIGNPHLVMAGTITLSYHLEVTGLVDPLQITWSSSGEISNRGGRTTSVTFSYPNMNPGWEAPEYVNVRVTDAEGQTLETRKSVSLYARPCDFTLPYWNSETQICQRFPP